MERKTLAEYNVLGVVTGMAGRGVVKNKNKRKEIEDVISFYPGWMGVGSNNRNRNVSRRSLLGKGWWLVDSEATHTLNEGLLK